MFSRGQNIARASKQYFQRSMPLTRFCSRRQNGRHVLEGAAHLPSDALAASGKALPIGACWMLILLSGTMV